ncbi:MAG: M20/M25/M40 family metallo-hydrolase [Polyangiaceae bacterium]|nr:M20/M25/M40 family metallo-hydrolase [Polyangiaceae bacterium]
MNDEELLALHRELVGIPSLSHQESALVQWLQQWFEARGHHPERIGQNLLLASGAGPLLCLNSHLDTVPPCSGWSRPPHVAQRIDGKVYGLGSNDAKASVAAMIAAYVRVLPRLGELGIGLMLALAVEEETGGEGAELIVQELMRRETTPDAVVIGEPTALDIVIAQKGLMVLELVATGEACHAAHPHARGAVNPIRTLARDLLAVDALDLGAPDALLGPITVEPTVLAGGSSRNTVPSEASCVLDVRTNPEPSPASLVQKLRSVVHGQVRVRSDRLRPCATPEAHPLVQDALEARGQRHPLGSRTLSDWVHFAQWPAIKVGPGATERSHTADEYVFEREVVQGASWYEALVTGFGKRAGRRKHKP